MTGGTVRGARPARSAAGRLRSWLFRQRASGTAPRVSVIMALYNGAADAPAAIRSILGQSLRDLELIVIDDGSTDDTVKVVQQFSDPRLRLICNERNLGLASSLNRGIGAARGEYIARMDGDDVSLRGRLARQLRFMERNPDVAVCGSAVRAFGHVRGVWRMPRDHHEIHGRLLFNNAIIHPSVMMRRSCLEQMPFVYEEGRQRVEDYELWVRMSRQFTLANLPQVLLRFRVRDIRTLAKHRAVIAAGNAIRKRLLEDLLGSISGPELELHMRISRMQRNDSVDFIMASGEWLLRIKEANDAAGIYNREAFARALGYRWWRICKGSAELGPTARRLYYEHPLSRHYPAHVLQRLGLLARCAIRDRNERLRPVLGDGFDYYGQVGTPAAAAAPAAVERT